jgi:hypothetical protein
VNENGVKIEIYSNDHGPPHAHVWQGSGDKKMNETTIGQDGKPLAGDPPLTKKQQRVVERNREKIRDHIRKYMQWHKENRC